MTAAEKAMEDIGAVVDGWPGNGRHELDALLTIARIVGAYSAERIGGGK